MARLGGIADLFLVHDRPIVRHVDDSVVRLVRGRELVLRRARGYAPLAMPIPGDTPGVVGVGAHLKNTVAVTTGRHLVVSQHIGDLETTRSSDAFHEVLQSLERLYHVTPSAVVVDRHPDYLSTRYGQRLGLPVTVVQHHYAHLAACMLDNDLTGDVLGAVWDGSGSAMTARCGAASSCARRPRGSRAWRACVRSGCPAATARCASRGVRRWACSWRMAATRSSDGGGTRLRSSPTRSGGCCARPRAGR